MFCGWCLILLHCLILITVFKRKQRAYEEISASEEKTLPQLNYFLQFSEKLTVALYSGDLKNLECRNNNNIYIIILPAKFLKFLLTMAASSPSGNG